MMRLAAWVFLKGKTACGMFLQVDAILYLRSETWGTRQAISVRAKKKF
jgi:hypothetical protein